MVKRFRDLCCLLPVMLPLFLMGVTPSFAEAVKPPSTEVTTVQQVEDLINTLEDPQQRERFVGQLRILIKAQEEEAPPIASSATAMLSALSSNVERLGQNAMAVAASINQIPEIYSWSQRQYQSDESRKLWEEVFANLFTIISIGYIAFFTVRWMLGVATRKICGMETEMASVKVSLLFGLFLLDLLPLAAFAGAAYVAAGLLDLREQTRLAVLAWVNAILLARVVIVFGRAVFAPKAPGLRLPKMDDESAHYADIWIRRLTVTPVYGYFVLQVALFLGIEPAVYVALLRLLGLLILGLLLVLVLQNRETLASWIVGDSEASRRFRGLRRRIARIWHFAAAAYLIIVYGIWAAEIPGGFMFLAKGTGLSLLALGVGYVLIKLINQLFERGLGVSADLQASFPKLQSRANRYLPGLQKIARVAVYGLVLLAVLQAWGMNTFGWLLSEPGKVMTSTIGSIIGIIVVSIAIWEGASFFIEGYLAEKNENGTLNLPSARAKTLLTVARKALLLALIILATLLALSELGINIAPLLATAGVLGLAIGFGSQKLVQDVIGGVFILLEDLFSVGDVIKVGDTAGLVEAVSIRNVRLRDFSGVVHTIPFSAISTISNLTKEFSFYVFDVGVAYREDVDEVMAVLKEIGAELQQDADFGPLVKEPLEVVGVDRFADSAVMIKARIKTLPIKQWSVGREFNRRMKNKFDELGIEIPFPHQTIYFGEDKTGKASPAHIDITQKVVSEPG